MPTLRPFRGLRYNPDRVADLAAVICPPYDVIEAGRRAELVGRDPYNAVRLELPVAGDDGAPAEAAYAEAAHLLADWQARRVLRRDARPMVYPYEQRYRLADGASRVARGFYCRLTLEDFGERSGVRPHERTMAGPKQDRYMLLRAVQANLSPVVLLFAAQEPPAVEALLGQLVAADPIVEAAADGVVHRLWAVDPDSSAAAAELLGAASARPLTIADGHHRYETALRFRDEQRRTGDAIASDQILALLYEAHTGGLQILPTHRAIRLVIDAPATLAAAADLFALEPAADPQRLAVAVATPGRLGLWTRAGGALLIVDRDRLAGLVPAGSSDALRWLDVSVLASTLERLVGSAAAELVAQDRIGYTKDAAEAVELVDSGAADVAFLLPPTPVEAVLEVAAAGEQMPQKSTYFEPKAATGLIFNPLAD